MHTCPMVTGLVPHVGGPIIPPCMPTVLTCMMPQARITDMATCVGPIDMIVQGAFTVLVGGLPAARMGDMTVHGGVIVTGCFTVLIGDAGGGGASGGDDINVDRAAYGGLHESAYIGELREGGYKAKKGGQTKAAGVSPLTARPSRSREARNFKRKSSPISPRSRRRRPAPSCSTRWTNREKR